MKKSKKKVQLYSIRGAKGGSANQEVRSEQPAATTHRRDGDQQRPFESQQQRKDEAQRPFQSQQQRKDEAQQPSQSQQQQQQHVGSGQQWVAPKPQKPQREKGVQKQQQMQQQQQQVPQNRQWRDAAAQKSAGQQKSRPSTSQSSIGSSASSSTSISPNGIKRGTVGKRDVVETNYLEMNLSKMPATAYHYDVSISPDHPKKLKRPVFEQFCATFLKNIAIAFDGRKSCYTMLKLPFKEVEEEIELQDERVRKLKFKVTIKETSDLQIDLNSLKNYLNDRIFEKPMRALQCLEIVLSNPCHGRGVRSGRSFYTKPKSNYDLDDGYEMWTGLYQSLILGDRPLMNVDISHKSFPKEMEIMHYLNNYTRIDVRREMDRRDISDLSSFVKNINITYRPPKAFGAIDKLYRVIAVTEYPARQLKFPLEDKMVTVTEYYASRGSPLKYPHLPCLQVGSTAKITYLPIEFCIIPPGQVSNKKDGPRQVQKMIKYAATSTDERKQKIMDLLEYFNHNSDITIQKFGLGIGAQFVKVTMRLLPSPMMEYRGSMKVDVRNGSWRMSNNTNFLITPQKTHKWAIIKSKTSRISYGQVNKLIEELLNGANKLNLQLDSKPSVEDFTNIETKLSDLKRAQYDLVVVIIPGRGTTYADIKQNAELKYGILTQCIKENTVTKRCDQMLATNLLLKVNAKLNGTNHRIDNNDTTTRKLGNVMFLGADVTHPSPDQEHIPSVVGVAASHDLYGACYNMQYRLQKSNKEDIEDMASIFEHCVRVYKRHLNKTPDHIIYYRDGVSDGQFKHVMDLEICGIRAACSKMNLKNIKVTCIVVVKRHHTRFFPLKVNPRDKFNNVEPGTVVDTVIVHPNEVQFFMVSHQSIQGTAKPTRYNVIQDDANLDIDFLQLLTYNLCHLFPRCNRVVSYPAPAYLAHLGAYRGRVYIENLKNSDDLKKSYREIQPDFLAKNPMYFV